MTRHISIAVDELRRVAVREWREDIERDHRIYTNTRCARCLLCGWKWNEHNGDELRHERTCPLFDAAKGR